MPNIILSPAPFYKPKEVFLPQGFSVAQISDAISKDICYNAICKPDELVIEVDGEYIPKNEWQVIPPEVSCIVFYSPVRGGGKSPLRIILSVVAVAASFFGGPEIALAFFAGSATMAAVASAAIMVASTFLINAVAPIRPPKTSSVKDPTIYSIAGSRNQIAPYQAVPVILGRVRFFPPLAAKAYTELDGDDEYVRMLFAWCGPCKIEDIRIGDTPIANFPGFAPGGGSSIEIREGWFNDAPISIMPGVTNQTRVDIKLTVADGWVDRVMPAGYDELSVEVAFPRGLIRYNKKGARKSASVEWKIRYREVGTSTWNYLDGTAAFSSASKTIASLNPVGITAVNNWSVGVSMGGTIQFFLNSPYSIPGVLIIGRFEVSNGIVSNITNLSIPTKTGLVISATVTNVNVSSGSINLSQSPFTITGTTTSLVRRAYYNKVDPTKSYEIGLLRVTPDSTSDKISDEIFWTIFRGSKNIPPLNFPVPMSQIAIRMKASETTQGQVDTVNCITSSYAQRFIGGVWESVITDVTQNPAAIFRGVLIHPANKLPRSLAQIDDVTLGQWYQLCEAQNYKFNQIREATGSVWDCLADVAFAGRGAPSLPYGKWSVDYDQVSRTIKGHVTPRNSWGFKSEKTLINMPHAFRVIFNNELNDYLEDEIIVYDDGYSAANATNIERLEFRGITNPQQVWKFGRYHIAQARLRPETYTVYMDFEHLTFRRNDLIMVSHDIPRWCDTWGRVKSVQTSGSNVVGVTIDEEVTMEVGSTYAIRFRLNDGSSLVMSVVNVPGTTKTLQFVGSVPITSGPEVDNLCMFNTSTNTAVELICLGLKRQNDLVAEVTFVDHAPEIYNADTGPIPPFNTHINGRIFPTVLPTPVIESIRGELYSDDYISAVIKQRIIITGSIPPVNISLTNRLITIRYRIKNSSEPWSEVTFTKEPISFNVPSEGIYEVIAKQSGNPAGLSGYFGVIESPWTSINEVQVFAIYELGLPAPSNPTGWYSMDATGTVSKVKLRLNVDISQSVPTGIALMVSVQEVPRELVVEDHGAYLKVINSNVLNSGSFNILAGSTSNNVVIATTSNPLPNLDLSGFFWGTLDGAEYRKATGSTSTSVQFNEPFTTNPITGNTINWVELAWSDERMPDFKLMNLISSGNTTEVAKWTAVNYTSGEYRILVDRAQEGTTQVSAVKAQYYPAPGAGTQTVTISANQFDEIVDNEFEGSADVQIVIPPGSWCAMTLSTYVIDGLRVIRSPIIPITNWRPM